MIAKESLEDVFETRFTSAQDNWKAKCPFHNEKTPSFYVHKDELIGHCFGCGISGFIDTLAAKYLGVDKDRARDRLSISPEEYIRARSRSSNKASRDSQAAPDYFPESWLSPWKKEVHKYVLQRGLNIETLQSADSRYDRSHSRQVFPHYNEEGKLLGAIGRTCKGEDPKWLFYWDYNKGQALYRTQWTETSRQQLIIVEGVFDALWLKQNGYTNVGACLGSHATSRQIREIRQSTKTVLLAFDNDEAGDEGTYRAYQDLRRTLRVEILEYPEFANDMMDLSKVQIDELIKNAKSPASSERLKRAAELCHSKARYTKPKKKQPVY